MEDERWDPLRVKVTSVLPWAHGVDAGLPRGEIEVAAAAVRGGQYACPVSESLLDEAGLECDISTGGHVHSHLQWSSAGFWCAQVVPQCGKLHTADGTAHAEAESHGGENQESEAVSHLG